LAAYDSFLVLDKNLPITEQNCKIVELVRSLTAMVVPTLSDIYHTVFIDLI